MGQGVLTPGFVRAPDGALSCEGVPIERVAREVGTPLYVYSAAIIRDRYSRLASVLGAPVFLGHRNESVAVKVPHRVHYTLKANSSRAILRLLREMGAGAEIVSGGELHLALAAGFKGQDIVFGGVGKTDDELREAIAAGVLLINVESEAELRRIDELGREARTLVPVGIRVNPELTLDTPHEYIKTGERGHKFGIPYDDALRVAGIAASLTHITLLGLDMHLGSQLSSVTPYKAGSKRLLELFKALRKSGVATLKYIDIGGGLSVRYDSEEPPDFDLFGDEVLPIIGETGLTLIMEPGRFIVGNAGMLVATVLYRKRSGGKEYVIADAGMTELLRPSHYGAYHRIEPVRLGGLPIVADVVGPVCESGDFLALDREIPDVEPGALIGVHDVGAYGYAMASNYNARRRAAEVLVDGDRYAVISRRESYDDLMRLAVEPDWRT